jgi:hypothetical protein
MLKSEVEFRNEDGFISVWYEDDRPPFKDMIMGALRKDDEGYYRFHSARKAVMTCKHLRVVMYKIAELNK